MYSVNFRNQRAIHEAINTQVLPQIQNTIRQVHGSNANNRSVQVETPEQRPGDVANEQMTGPSLFKNDILHDNREECPYSRIQKS